MDILAVVPVRRGSKGVPRKNIRLLAGNPLIAYTICEAQKLRYITRLFVSTEDEEIARIAGDLGAEVPFMRPKKRSWFDGQYDGVSKLRRTIRKY